MTEVVDIKNVSRRAHVIVLDHGVFKTREHGFQIKQQPYFHETRDGVRTLHSKRQSLPGSITLQPGESRELHPAIAAVPQVRELVARKELSVSEPHEQTAPAPNPPQSGSEGAKLPRRTRPPES